MNKAFAKEIFAYFGHHKCATTWLNDILGQVCKRIGLSIVIIHNSELFNDYLESIKKNQIDFLSYINADIENVKKLENNFIGFHVVRDPRDIVVSAYYSHLYSHPVGEGWPELIEHRKNLQNSSKDKGLFLEMDFLDNFVFQNLYNWDYRQPNVKEIKMEDLIKDPSKVLLDVFEFLHIIDNYDHTKIQSDYNPIELKDSYTTNNNNPHSISHKEILSIIYNNRFSLKANGRKSGEEDVKSHYRKGSSGDWIHHFNPEHKKYFKEKYNDLLIMLGYENQNDW